MPVIGIAGNHDWPFQNSPKAIKEADLPWTYLQDSSTTFKGLNVYGTPWSKEFGDWAFMKDELRLTGKWNMIPDDTDILICHGPPKYYGDRTWDGRFEGSEGLTWRIGQVSPKLVVFGHIHEGRGDWQFGDTRLANVTLMDKHHEPGIHKPWVYEME